MKCPMLTMYAITFKPPEEFKDRDCIKEECAWWDVTRERCMVNTIGDALEHIDTRLCDLDTILNERRRR